MFLKKIKPTPEQRKLFFLEPNRPVFLSGRAGSGKTTTAILRAAQLVNFYARQGLNAKVGIFVFNNTLRKYLNDLANLVLEDINYEVHVIDAWCKDFLEQRGLLEEVIADESTCKTYLNKAIEASSSIVINRILTSLRSDFLIEEVNYLLGRFGLDTVKYIESKREGRGTEPAIDNETKIAIAQELVPNYQLLLRSANYIDFNQLRERVLDFMRAGIEYDKYDILIVDEAQDLSALQVQILLELVSPKTKSITFIRDTTQRIYKNNYIWNDINLNFGINSILDLEKNYRNTREIAMIAASLMETASLNEDDINVIDPVLIKNYGLKPIWARGRYTQQENYLFNALKSVNTNTESVGILHVRMSDVGLLGEKLKKLEHNCYVLNQDDLDYAQSGIYLSTLHSAKGLEFDHVFIIGYDDFFAPGPYKLSHRNTSAHLSSHRRLLYTAITRARKTLTITSSKGECSRFLKDIDDSLFNIINL
jgi:superfamily I DNA/RNA helicase